MQPTETCSFVGSLMLIGNRDCLAASALVITVKLHRGMAAGLAGTGAKLYPEVDWRVPAGRLSSAARIQPRLVRAKCLGRDSRTIAPSVEKEPQDVSSYRVSRSSGSSAKLLVCKGSVFCFRAVLFSSFQSGRWSSQLPSSNVVQNASAPFARRQHVPQEQTHCPCSQGDNQV